ncbi:DNA repair protein RecO [Alkalicella caledoniensis]|uniref:DNA repair protein RecO n=1 Tax=Alkalicella caledoniensis TaxID=2731377 RepID=A0A7G9W4D8_ALKCA|nr:DNA repair protein RecO [Alkalicella caledoniensis]QNO13550.1 DNA repair protein RecO [Alkalicella caledoniensis]
MLYKTKGIVLKSFPFSEADTIVTIFTKENGKIEMLAKGAKKLKSRLSSSVQPFTLGEYTYYQKNNNLPLLRQADVLDHYKNLMKSLSLTFSTYYICELLDFFLPSAQEQSKVFDLTAKTLDYLNRYPDNHSVILSAFKIKAMALLGYSPQLASCVHCGRGHSDNKFIFSIKDGGIICRNCIPQKTAFLAKKEIYLLLLLLKSTFEDILKIDISINDLTVVDSILVRYIKYHCDGRTFKSEDFLKNYT